LKLSLKTKFGPGVVPHHSGPDDNSRQYTRFYVEYKSIFNAIYNYS
jgi:hypothetical protein